MPPTGIEPVRCFHRGILSPLRLPVPPRRLTVWYCSAKRGNCQSAKSCHPECKKANGLFAANGKAAHFMWQCTRYFRAIPHNSKCRYGERGAADAKLKAQIILDAAKVSAASGGNSEPKQGQRSQSARGFCPRSTMRGTATRHYRAFWQRRCRAAAAEAVLKPLGGNCAVLP